MSAFDDFDEQTQQHLHLWMERAGAQRVRRPHRRAEEVTWEAWQLASFLDAYDQAGELGARPFPGLATLSGPGHLWPRRATELRTLGLLVLRLNGPARWTRHANLVAAKQVLLGFLWQLCVDTRRSLRFYLHGYPELLAGIDRRRAS